MKGRGNKLFVSCIMGAALAFWSMTAQAAEAVVTAEDKISEYENILSLDNCAIEIKDIYKAKYPEQAGMIDDIVNTLTGSDEFIAIFNDEGPSAFCIVEDSLLDVLEPAVEPYMYTDELYTTKYLVPAVRQIDSYSCGPASTVMALIGSGASGYSYTTNTNTLNAWQNSLKTQMGTDTTGTYIGEITKVLQANVPSRNGYTYKTKAFTKYSYNKALGFIESSLMMDAVPVIRVADTSLLGYYNGHSCSHYMVVTQVDILAQEVTLVDPHYNNQYFGVHNISFSEFENMAKNSSDFWVSTYTNVSGNGSYEYN